MIEQKYMTVIRDAPKYTGLSKNTIRRAIRRGDLKAMRIGRRTMTSKDWLEEWLTSRGRHIEGGAQDAR